MSTILSPPSSNIWTQPASPRKGGILLKQLPDGSDSTPSSPTKATLHLPTSPQPDVAGPPLPAAAGSPPALDRSSPPLPPQVKIVDHGLPPTQRVGDRAPTQARPASIKFAPLPAPRQQRSLSTGRNVKLAATLGPNGERTEELQTNAALGEGTGSFHRRRDSDDSGLMDGVGDQDGNDDDGYYGGGGVADDDLLAGASDADDGLQKRRSSMLGSSWTKGTMKLFGVKSSSSSSGKKLDRTSSIESNGSAVSGHTSDLSARFSSLTRTLSPSVSRSSTGSDAAERQARLLASLSPAERTQSTGSIGGPRDGSPALNGHRRRQSGGSLEPPSSSWSLGASSPGGRSLVGARMLNGRAYGVRGGVEAIRKAEEDARRGPEFSEWGSVGSMGSNSLPGDGGDDDGSGVSWARKRREAREKAAAERAAAEAAAAEAAASSTDDSALLQAPSPGDGSPASPSSASGQVSSSSPVTPRTPVANLDPVGPSSVDSVALSEADLDASMASAQQQQQAAKARALSHDVQAYTVPGNPHPRAPDVDGSKTPTARSASHATVGAISIGGGANAHAGAGRGVVVDDSDEDDLELSDSDSDDDDDLPRDDDDDDEDGSSGEDDDDKAAMEEARKTALCAGVEVVSRHKDVQS